MQTHSNHESPQLRLAILQRVIPPYRMALFTKLCADETLYVKLFIGEDIPHTKVKSTPKLDGLRVEKFRTNFIKIGRRIFPLHKGLMKGLREFKPDVILCEGESHFLGYLQAIFYRLMFNRSTVLIHWCFISLPGEPLDRTGLLGKVKAFFRSRFDAFLLYSSFSKDRVIKLGVPEQKTFVATNVGDVKKYLALSDALKESQLEIRKTLKLPDKFTVLYTGTLDKNKKPDMMLELAKVCDPDRFNFVVLGNGEMFNELQQRVEKEKLQNLYLPGRVTDNLTMYYKASDVLLVPGRGGIVISEGMAFNLPVVTYQADGTECDLIKDNISGLILKNGEVSDFKKAIERLESDPDEVKRMGSKGRELVEKFFTTENMVTAIRTAARFAMNTRLAN